MAICRGVYRRINDVKFHYRIGKNEFEALDFVDFWERSEIVAEKKMEEERQSMTQAAFIGYQFLMGQGCLGKGTTLKKYLQGYNLIEQDKPMSKKQITEYRETAYQRAKRIMSSDKAAQSGK